MQLMSLPLPSSKHFKLGSLKTLNNFHFFYRNFLTTLATFPKIIVCEVKALTSGLNLMMLPLFDIVVAEQNAEFSLSNASIGSNIEGISIFQLSPKVNYNAVSL
jgi:enoyl-CoA hydratase/carnithine racemase